MTFVTAIVTARIKYSLPTEHNDRSGESEIFWYLRPPIPIALHINRESRNVSLHHYLKLSNNASHSRPVWFHPQLDTFALDFRPGKERPIQRAEFWESAIEFFCKKFPEVPDKETSVIMQRKYISKQKIHLIEEQGSEFFENRLFNFRRRKEFIIVGEEAGSDPGFSPYPDRVYELRSILKKGFKARKDADATQNVQTIGDETTNNNLKLCVPNVTFYHRARKPSLGSD